jgi:hypothetical protein
MTEFHGQKDRDDHTLAIGKITQAWNEFQELLGEVYAEICGRDKWAASLAKWHALKDDRRQRSMLLTAAKATLKDPALGALTWTIEMADQLHDRRNTAVHMPLMSFTDEIGNHQILPLTVTGNPHASKMAGHDLLAEYAHSETQIRTMLSYAHAIKYNLSAVRAGPEVWPEKPTLS